MFFDLTLHYINILFSKYLSSLSLNASRTCANISLYQTARHSISGNINCLCLTLEHSIYQGEISASINYPFFVCLLAEDSGGTP